MKTKIDEMDSSKVKSATTTYVYDKYPLVILTEVKGMGARGEAYSSRRVHAKIPCRKYEYLKQLTLMQAKYASPCELPYTIDRCDSTSGVYLTEDCIDWANALAVSHVKQNGFLFVSKERFEEFERDILAIDFRVYDEKLANDLSKKYKPAVTSKMVTEVDAVAIEEDR